MFFILMLVDRSIFIKYSSIKLIFLFHSITQDYGEEDTYYFVGGLLQFTYIILTIIYLYYGNRHHRLTAKKY